MFRCYAIIRIDHCRLVLVCVIAGFTVSSDLNLKTNKKNPTLKYVIGSTIFRVGSLLQNLISVN